ncbi:hypothetical protein PM082_007139 [Marasmius tenuissimus]|nr:hypothetical protein PM082_007139 [Marasmius tenuissimus]
MGRLISVSLFLLLTTSLCQAFADHFDAFPRAGDPHGEKAPTGKVFKRADGKEIPPYDTVYHFDQLIDHDDPSLGTFKQRYWHTAEFYEPGGPIIVYSPGEGNAEGHTSRLTNSSITGHMAQLFNGATVLLEHRFYGYSNPYPDLKGTTLAKYHTLEQAVNDLEYFAKNVKLPMEGGDDVGPEKAPWILSGCSYMGALTAWTMQAKPGLFHAGWSSSAPVQPIYNFWRYYEPIRKNMAKNCSADAQAVINYVDKTLDTNDANKIRELKDVFGMANVSNVNDFAGALTRPFWTWQSVNPLSGAKTDFNEFCDALEVDGSGQHASDQGWGEYKALQAWGKYYKETWIPKVCGSTPVGQCFTRRAANDIVDPKTINTTINNSGRSWDWQVCSQVGWHQAGAPGDEPTPRLVSKYHTLEWANRPCKHNFPDAPTDTGAGINKTISTYKGWDLNVDRLVTVYGGRDPWIEASLGASTLNRASTDRMPIIFAEQGTHCSEISMRYGQADPTIGVAMSKAIEHMKKWMAEWHEKNGKPSSSSGKTTTTAASDVTEDKVVVDHLHELKVLPH